MIAVQRDITFKPSQAFGRSGALITFAQDEIHINGRKIGYVGHGVNESAALVAPVDDETRTAIAEAVTVHRGSAPRSVVSAPIIPDESEDEGGDDE